MTSTPFEKLYFQKKSDVLLYDGTWDKKKQNLAIRVISSLMH